MLSSYLPIILVFFLFLMNVPIAYSLIASSLYYFMFITDIMPVDLVLQRFVSSLESFPLLAVPFFILAGVIMNYSGISKRLMNFAEVCVGHMKGGLAQVNVLLSALLGGVSGSANADAAMQSKILVPEMEKRGYSKAFSAAITASSSTISPIIPPGIIMIFYCLASGASIGAMFMAGYLPGIMMTLALMFMVNLRAKKKGYAASREAHATASEIFQSGKDAMLALFMPLGILLGLRFGLFTPTEAGAFAVAYCTIIGAFVYKELKWHHARTILLETIKSNSQILMIIVGANLFGYYLNMERIPQMLTQLIISVCDTPEGFLLLANITYLIVGMFIEGGAAILILSPLLLPVVRQLGIDPVHFGIITVVNIAIGGLTPPFGSMLFTTGAIVKVSILEIAYECMPFIGILLVVLGIITYVPEVVTFLPNLLM